MTTRRDFLIAAALAPAILAAGCAVTRPEGAVVPPTSAQEPPKDPYKALREFEVPFGTEPATVFRARVS